MEKKSRPAPLMLAAKIGNKSMNTILKQPLEIVQEQSPGIERFILYQFSCGLGKGIKSRIKSCGCQWNGLYRGWLCPLGKAQQVEKHLHDAKLTFSARSVPFPEGMISSNPKIAGKEARLDILENEVFKEENDLLQIIVKYDRSLRPSDFAEPPSEENKSIAQIQIEKDFHLRVTEIAAKKDEIEKIRKELLQLKEAPELIVEGNAPVRSAEMIIKNRFSDSDCRTLQYCIDSFWRWNGFNYEEINEGEIRNIVYTFFKDAKEVDTSGNFKIFNPKKSTVDQIIDALKALCYQKYHPSNGPSWIDGRISPNPRQLIPFRNGLLCLTDWLFNLKTDLIPHTPSFLSGYALPFHFNQQCEEPSEWLNFLNAIWSDDPDSIQLIQEWIGYLLIQDTSIHKILLIVGPTRSGKGTIGRIIRELLGHENVVGPTLSGLAGEFGLEPLLNKSLALISDARLNSRGNNNVIIERLLSISGEDPLTINRKFKTPFTIQLPTRIMLMSNELPEIKDASGALTNRYLVLTMKKSWLGKEDSLLYNRLKTELPYILTWALKGLKRLKQRGHFIQPISSAPTIEDLEAATSPVKAFVSERCTLTACGNIAVQDLYDAWRDWCMRSGISKPGSVQSLGKLLKAAFPELYVSRPQDDSGRTRQYVGITLRRHDQPSADVRGPRILIFKEEIT